VKRARVKVRPLKRARPLTDFQVQALDLLVEAIEEHGQPGPWPDQEPAVPIETWRTKLKTLFQDHSTPRQMVRRTMRTLIATGCVLERAGVVAVGNFAVQTEVTK
jgi:hypothetical protein